MRCAFLALAVAAGLAPPAARAADLPPIVVQFAPLGKVLDDVRGMARAVGGDAAVKEFNDNLKAKVGEDGLAALDLNRSVVFGVYLRPNAPKDKDGYGYGIAHVNDEKGFLALLKKGEAKIEPLPGRAGTYRVVPAKSSDEPTFLRVADGKAVMGFGMTEAEFDPAKAPDYEKLVAPTEVAPLSVRVYVERFPAEMQKQMGEALDKGIEQAGHIPVPPDAQEGLKKATEKIGAAFKHYLTLVKQTDELIFRLTFDPATSEAALEAGLIGKRGTSLAKEIAGRKPTTNRFGGLMGKETVAAFALGLPLGEVDLREGLALAFEAGGAQGLANAPPPAKPVVEELLKGLVRTVRSGEFDGVVALDGPSKDGTFTAVVGLSFDDPAGLEKQLRTLIEKEAPPPIKDLVNFDAAKVGDVQVHTAKVGAFLPPNAQKVFGAEAAAALAFAPKGIYVAFGTDPVAALKAALAAKPQETRLLDVSVNPARMEKLASANDGEEAGARMVKALGTEDKLASAFFVSVEGGAELKVRLGLNVKLLPRAGFATSGSKPTPNVIK